MLRFSLVFALLIAGSPAFADESPKPAALTPMEIADGWLLLFDGETTFGWTIDGQAEVKDGVLTIGGEKETTATLNTRFGSYDVHLETAGGVGLLVFTTPDGLTGTGLTNQPTRATVSVRKGADGESSGSIQVGKDGVAKQTEKLTTSVPTKFGFRTKPGQQLKVTSVKLKPVGMEPLFDGKSLDGWKVFEGDPNRTKSKFAVTEAGELSVKDGAGDLQTTKQFDDFVLQLECKTNGKWLNSGIFFRCLPDQYQNGYEAQIQNGWVGDRTMPVDYGTGAIYRRVKARKVVSDDNEWFTLTLVATGPHIATWVNGYQVVDWTDDREPDENPRKGLKTGKGHLSIQGHDPTTDLLFRNIRLAEIPTK